MLAILLVDHGSRRREANAALERIGDLVQERVGLDVVVRVAHMELAHPSIEEGLLLCATAGAREVIVHPYMLSAGRHATEDLPRLVAAAAERVGIRARITEPLGVHPLIAEVVLERCGLGRGFEDAR